MTRHRDLKRSAAMVPALRRLSCVSTPSSALVAHPSAPRVLLSSA